MKKSLNNKNMISIASGLVGTGKTWFAINLANAFGYLKQKTLFFDADLGFMNIDFQLGLGLEHGVYDVVLGYKTLNQVVSVFDKIKFDVITGQYGLANLESIPIGRVQILNEDLISLSPSYDKVIVDLGDSLGKASMVFSGASNRTILLCTAEPNSLIEGYEFIKKMKIFNNKIDVDVVINQVSSIRDGQRHYESLLRACENNLEIYPKLLGVVRKDSRVRDTIRNKTTMIQRYPVSEAAIDILNIARKIIENGE